MNNKDEMAAYGKVVSAMMQREKEGKVERFKRLNRYVKKGQILFAGSSLMEQFPIHEFLLDYELPYTIYNRGIGGYTTDELLEVMDTCIYDLEPSVIFLNIGTNDMNGNDFSMDKMIANYRAILTGIKERLPQTKIFLLAYYPVNQEVMKEPMLKAAFSARTNQRVLEANEEVKKLALEMGATYVDLNAGITDEQGNLKEDYTVEGIHMYADGYNEVLKVLEPILKTI